MDRVVDFEAVSTAGLDSSPVSAAEVDGIRMPYVLYESGRSVHVMYSIDDERKRAVGFKLSHGVEVPAELAGTIRGSCFVIRGER